MATKRRKQIDVTSEFISHTRFNIKDFKFTEKQRDLIRLIKEPTTKIVFCEGVAGTGKSLVATFAGLRALQDGSRKRFIYLRAAVESSNNKLGFLPGELEDKLSPHFVALEEKLEELLDFQSVELLKESKTIVSISPNFLRGVTWHDQYVFVDEAQQLSFKEFVSILSRVGENTTLVFAGDPMQSDVRNSGFQQMMSIFADEESKEHGIHDFHFTSEDVKRSAILRFIMGKLEKISSI
jgi:phosphate starvation-inducible PhoH-like protein